MRVNTLLVRYRDGFTEVEDSAQVTADGERIGGFVNYPDDSLSEATLKAEATIASLKEPRWQSRIKIEPTFTTDWPFSDFFVGDTITVPDQDGSPSTVQVLEMRVSDDGAGHPIYEPTVGVNVKTLGERQGVVNRTTGGRGTLGGRDPQAQTVGPSRSAGSRVVSPPAVGGGVVGAFAASISGPSGGVGDTLAADSIGALSFSWDTDVGQYHTANVSGFDGTGSDTLTLAPGLWSFSFDVYVTVDSGTPTEGAVAFDFITFSPGVNRTFRDFIDNPTTGAWMSCSQQFVFLADPGVQYDSDTPVLLVSWYNSTDVAMDVFGRVSGVAFEVPNIIDSDFSGIP